MLEKPRPWWVLWSVVPFGWLSWVGLVYAGARARMPLMIVVAVLFLASTVVAFATSGDDDGPNVSGAVSIIGYVAGVGVSLGFAPIWQRKMRRLAEPLPIDRAKERLDAREEAIELARTDPTLAREAGVGRPDVTGAQHGGVVDVNSAPHSVLAQLSGVDDATASEIVRLREELDGFTSLMDLGSTLDLPADTVEDLRGRVVFIPR